MKRLFVVVVVSGVLGAGVLQAQRTSPEITAGDLKEHVKYLASDELDFTFTILWGWRTLGGLLPRVVPARLGTRPGLSGFLLVRTLQRPMPFLAARLTGVI